MGLMGDMMFLLVSRLFCVFEAVCNLSLSIISPGFDLPGQISIEGSLAAVIYS
jgi:hypothetical protein